MNNIDVVIYSYKSKRVNDLLSSIFNNKSNLNDVTVHVFDQHPFNRQETFSKLFNIKYRHITWDSITTPCEFKDEVLGQSKAKYILMLSDCVILNNNWDQILIEMVNDSNKIISGNTGLSLSIENFFYLKPNKVETQKPELTNFIDTNFIFGKASVLQSIKYPVYVKYFGEAEALSVEYFTRGYDIYSCSPSVYSVESVNSIEALYCPFSNRHGYNDVIDLLKNGKNRFTSLEARDRSINDFEAFHEINLQNINKLPYSTDDVLYNPDQLKFNAVDARRFIKNPGTID